MEVSGQTLQCLSPDDVMALEQGLKGPATELVCVSMTNQPTFSLLSLDPCCQRDWCLHQPQTLQSCS